MKRLSLNYEEEKGKKIIDQILRTEATYIKISIEETFVIYFISLYLNDRRQTYQHQIGLVGFGTYYLSDLLTLE